MGPKKRSSDVQLGASKKKKKTDTTGQVFLPSYTVQFPWIRKSNASKYKAHCMICMDEFGINHGGKSDIERHEGTDKHDKNSKLNKSTTSLNFATATSTDRVSAEEEFNLKVMNAEALAAQMIAESNSPIALADMFNNAVKMMLSDSKIASKFQCGRNKTFLDENRVLNNNTLKELRSCYYQSLKKK